MSRYEAMAGIHAVVVAVVRHVNLLVIGSIDGTTSRWKSGTRLTSKTLLLILEMKKIFFGSRKPCDERSQSCHVMDQAPPVNQLRSPEPLSTSKYDLLPRLPCPCPCDDRQITAGLRPDLLSDIGFFDRDVSQNVPHRKMFCIGIPKECLLASILPVGIFSHERVSPLSAACQADEPSSQVERLAAAQFWIQQVRAGSSSTAYPTSTMIDLYEELSFISQSGSCRYS
ncbi:uncharacterized protein RSE6_09525 [Rhynchosporium secalis]|uniref:Uncharacterized protein n=1 Tax=Rhynchosporium secalis TaxID=38038 RepID=A0A1E1MJB0_RHYSE|nr:uncharacterized protein RSE6_09525 [Rhynchosporium secalis]